MKHTTSSRAGFSLILSLIILTLLAILVVGFISSTALDRVTAHAFSNKAQAQLAAETAVSAAVSIVRENIAAFPDSATMWENLDAPKTSDSGGTEEVTKVEGTVLYYNERPPPVWEADGQDTKPTKYVLPLLSTGVDAEGKLRGAVEMAKKSEALGTERWTVENSVDLNRPRFTGDRYGWIGAALTDPTQDEAPAPDGLRLKRKPLRAKWIDVKERVEGKESADPDRRPKTIGRYAFWIEDESFKVNLNLLGAKDREDEKTSPGASPTEIPFQGLLRSARAPSTVNPASLALNAFDLRNGLFGKRVLEARAFNQVPGEYRIADETKFFATIFSGGLNLSRHGSQRLNLNGLGFEKTDASPEEIDKQIEKVVQTIRYHTPQFGQRFYRLFGNTATLNVLYNELSPGAQHSNIYLHKLAANIRDYIDPDLQPTIITSDGKVMGKPPEPVLAMSAQDGENLIWAQGKESAPFIQEAVVRFRPTVGGPRYNLKVDYYIEFWNMTNRDVYAAPQPGRTDPHHLNSPYVKIASPVGWHGHLNGNPELKADNLPAGDPGEDRDVVIDLVTGVSTKNGIAVPGGVVFKAGACTVIATTADPLTQPTGDGAGGSVGTTGGFEPENTYFCQVVSGKREFTGDVPAGCDGIWPQFRDGSGQQEDYGTEVIFANGSGYLDTHPFTISKGGGPSAAYKSKAAGTTSRDDTYGGTLFGNAVSPSQLGDPRTNNEQLSFKRYKPGGTTEPDQTRYFNPFSQDSARFSLGWPNSRFVAPHLPNQWKDYYKVWEKTAEKSSPIVSNPTDKNAPAFIANENLRSIGQLGDIFDPARMKGGGSLGIVGARGGGRTLKIGQPDDLIDTKNAGAKSQQWASWRLVDFLSTTGRVFEPGLININGLRRDNGAALRAACYGMTLHSVPPSKGKGASPPMDDPPLDSEEYPLPTANAGLQQFIAEATEVLKSTDEAKPGNGVFMERGQISELPIFNTGKKLLAGVDMAEAFDRTREELFRRLATLLTTRGSTFSVYAIGQSITEGPPPQRTRRVTGSHQVKVTFQLVPKKADGSDFQATKDEKVEVFDSSELPAVRERFAKPDHYDIQILQVSS